MSDRMPWKTWVACGLVVVAGGIVLAEFVKPMKHERAGAVGSLEGLSKPMQRAFTERDDFQTKKAPEANDWLAQHDEKGQTFGRYLRSKANKPTGVRKTLYILPLGEFEKGKAPRMELLKKYMGAYYDPLTVEVLPAVAAADVPAKKRINPHSEKEQWKSTEILAWLPKKLPDDAYAMVAVTMTDLYPDEAWNFVFGQATYRNRVGVFSFARYHPTWDGHDADEGTEALVLRRAAKVLTHETGHMFGIHHCVHYECNMNGSNHLEETDAAPIHLCPVCLRKMQHAIGFDPGARYTKLSEFYRANGLKEEREWVEKRRKWVEGE